MTQNKTLPGLCRVAWQIGQATGHGDWHDQNDRDMLQSHVDANNRTYGPGSHRIEDFDGTSAAEETQALLKRMESPKLA